MKSKWLKYLEFFSWSPASAMLASMGLGLVIFLILAISGLLDTPK